MIRGLIACLVSFQLAFAPAIANAQEDPPQPSETTTTTSAPVLPELSYSFGKSGTTLTLKTDMYLLLPETWAFINHERRAMHERYQLEFDTSLALERQKFDLVVGLRDSQIEYLNRELARTNDLLVLTQKQKSMSEWTPVLVAGAVILGMLITTASVYALTKGEGIQQ